MEVIFWICAFALFYTYLGYPLLVLIFARLLPKKVATSQFEPNVTVLITAYNEEKDIKEKIENTLALDYPKNKLEVIVASDGSTDRTDHIVGGFEEAGVKLFRQERLFFVRGKGFGGEIQSYKPDEAKEIGKSVGN